MRGRREQIHLQSGQSFRLLRWNHNLREVESVLPGGRALRIVGEGQHWHYHVEMELTQFTGGEGIRFVGDNIGVFSAGDVVLLGSNLPHHWHARGNCSGLSLQWCFTPGHAFWSFPETFQVASLFKSAARGLRYSGKTAGDILTALKTMAGGNSLRRMSLLLQLFERLLNCPENECTPLSGRTFSFPSALHHQHAISEVVRYLLANYREEIRLREVLRLAGMSKPTFARQFRKHAGKTFSEFLTHVRLRSACRDLEDTDLPILEIAHASGFSHISYFNRIFRRLLAANPSRYRAQQRKSEKNNGQTLVTRNL